METRHVLLLIADIGGYTSYMQSHRSMLGHAEAATTRLLKQVIDAARGFELIEIEGDAAFLSRDAEGLDDAAALAAVESAAVAMHRAFHAERKLVERNLCPCESCTETSELKLKFVAHVGEVAIQEIGRHRKLVGMDVIFVHRLLKNSVPVPEYVLLSEDLHGAGGVPPAARQVREITMDLEGLGSVKTYFVEVSDLDGGDEPVPDPSGLRRLGGTLGMVGRGLPYALRLRRPAPTAR
jgi:class 3 adenylate cyclase